MNIKIFNIAEENTSLQHRQFAVLILLLVFIALSLIPNLPQFIFLTFMTFFSLGILYLKYLDEFGSFFISKETIVIDFENKRVKSTGIEVPFNKIYHFTHTVEKSLDNKNNGHNTFTITTNKGKKYDFKILLKNREELKSFKDTMERLTKATTPF
jgi:hypothetical protein